MSVDVRAKLAEKGITLPVATKPLAAYVPAVRTGNIVFTAGQLPMVDGAIAKTGKVGADVSVEEAYELAKICAINALAAVELVAPVDSIVKVVRIVCYVNGAAGFVSQPAVANGASELFMHIWGDAGVAARSALGVAELPLNSPVEVELTVEVALKAITYRAYLSVLGLLLILRDHQGATIRDLQSQRVLYLQFRVMRQRAEQVLLV